MSTQAKEIPRWSRTTRYLISVTALILLATFFYSIRAILTPLIIAGLLAYLLNPAVIFLKQRTGWEHKHVVKIVYFFHLLILIAAPLILIPIIINQAELVLTELTRIEEEIGGLVSDAEPFLGITFSLPDALTQIRQLFAEILHPSQLFGFIQAATLNLAWILLILVVPYYLLRGWERLRDWLIGLAPPSQQAAAKSLYEEISDVWQAYLRGQLSLMLAVGVLSTLVGLAIGLPGAVLLGLLAGLLDIIPSLGPTVAMLLAMVVAWFQGSIFLPISNSWFVLLVMVAYMLVQVFENIYLRPRIVGSAIRMHPGLVFLAVMAAIILSGVLAALIIIPTLSSLAVIGRYLRDQLLR